MQATDCASDALSGEPGKSSKKNEWLFVNPYLVAGVLGASLCFTWFFAALIGPSVLWPGADELSLPLFSAGFVVSLLLSYVVVGLFANFLQSHRGVVLTVALASSVLALVPLGGFWNLSGGAFLSTLLALRIACAGIGVATLSSLWVEFLCAQLKGQVRVAVAALMAMSTLWNVGLVFVDERFAPAVLFLYALVSGCIYLFLRLRFSLMDSLPIVDAKESDKRCQISWQPSLLTVMGSLAQGFSLYWLLLPNAHAVSPTLAVAALIFIAAASVLVDSLGKFVMRESLTRRLMLPVIAACFLALLFTPPRWRFVACLLAFAFSMLPYESAVFATCEHIVRCRLSSMRTYANARLYAVGGLLLGFAFGWLAFSSELIPEVNLQVWVVVVVMSFIVVSTTLSTESFYPGEDPVGNGVVRISVNGEIASSQELASLIDGKKYFQEKCDAVAKRYGLTNRQTEVLYLLAKGRNVAYIQEKLVISPHTAKAHIYTIYKKTDRHSQQDLMDLVEEFELDGEGGAR